MTNIDGLNQIRNCFRSVGELVNFNEFSYLFNSDVQHLLYIPSEWKYIIWEHTADGRGYNELECCIDKFGKIYNSIYLGIVRKY